MKFVNVRLVTAVLLLFSLVLVGCAPSGTETMDDHDMENMDDQDMENMDDHEHDDSAMASERIPNDGAVVTIISPEDGASFPVGQQVLLEIEVENFDLSEEGNHWHVYVDGSSWGMVMGGNTDQPLTGLSAGEHMIEVYLSVNGHEEMEDGDSMMLTMTE